MVPVGQVPSAEGLVLGRPALGQPRDGAGRRPPGLRPQQGLLEVARRHPVQAEEGQDSSQPWRATQVRRQDHAREPLPLALDDPAIIDPRGDDGDRPHPVVTGRDRAVPLRTTRACPAASRSSRCRVTYLDLQPRGDLDHAPGPFPGQLVQGAPDRRIRSSHPALGDKLQHRWRSCLRSAALEAASPGCTYLHPRADFENGRTVRLVLVNGGQDTVTARGLAYNATGSLLGEAGGKPALIHGGSTVHSRDIGGWPADTASLKVEARALRAMMDAESRTACEREIRRFTAECGAKSPKAVASLTSDQERLLTHFAYPAEHWKHLRSTSPIESAFATVRLRERVTKGANSRTAGLTMAFKLLEVAAAHWQVSTAPRWGPLRGRGALRRWCARRTAGGRRLILPNPQPLTIASFGRLKRGAPKSSEMGTPSGKSDKSPTHPSPASLWWSERGPRSGGSP